MTPAEARSLLETVSSGWVADPSSDVEWAGDYEGRWGVRMSQQVRDYTTVWFDVGDETVGYEAYVIPSPRSGHTEVYRQCLVRNAGWRRVHYVLDHDGGIYLRGRVALEHLTPKELDAILGAIYEAVEVSFLGLIRAGFAREKND